MNVPSALTTTAKSGTTSRKRGGTSSLSSPRSIRTGAKHRAKDVFVDRRAPGSLGLSSRAGRYTLGQLDDYARSPRPGGRSGSRCRTEVQIIRFTVDALYVELPVRFTPGSATTRIATTPDPTGRRREGVRRISYRTGCTACGVHRLLQPNHAEIPRRQAPTARGRSGGRGGQYERAGQPEYSPALEGSKLTLEFQFEARGVARLFARLMSGQVARASTRHVDPLHRRLLRHSD